jgi:hypothetical protein
MLLVLFYTCHLAFCNPKADEIAHYYKTQNTLVDFSDVEMSALKMSDVKQSKN